MSTVDHVLAQCGQLRAAWGWLAEAVIPGRGRRNQRALTKSATAKRNRQATAERNDRHAVLTSGRVPTGDTSAPTNLAAVDAREKVANQVDEAAWGLASHLRNRVQVPYRAGQPAYRPDGRNADHRFRAGIDWISLNAARLTPDDQPIINSTYRALVDATTTAAVVAGCGPDQRPLAAECPACGRRALRWDCSSPEPVEWHVLCVNPRCRCAGRDCPCKLPDRMPGMTHLWLEAGWERFAAQIDQQEHG